MSVSSLTKFTVPIDGDQSASSQGLLMPKLKYRFRASFENFGISTPRTEMTKQVMNITRPAVTFEEQQIDIYNSKVYLVGKHTWDPVTITMRDDVNVGVTKLCGEQIQKQFDFMEQSSASSGIDYKFIMKFDILDGGNGASTPSILETWEMYGCYLQNANYGDLNYATNDPATIAMTVAFDNAVQTPLGTGVGASVTRGTGVTITG